MIRVDVRYFEPDGRLNKAGHDALKDVDRIAAIRAAVADIPDPAGGAVVDVEARAAIVAIKAALG